ncbi:hypothetical protein R6Z07F_012579 [Ovis aries]
MTCARSDLGGGPRATPPAEPRGAERSRAPPSAAGPSRAARSRLVQLRPRRPAVRGSGVAAASASARSAPAGRPAARQPGGRPGARGERPGHRRRRRRRCQDWIATAEATTAEPLKMHTGLHKEKRETGETNEVRKKFNRENLFSGNN